jgi:mono/diheme cytochrome c family protein
MKKYFILMLFSAAIVACANKSKESAVAKIDGEKLFKSYCVLCHGEDGKLGLNDSKDLTVSKLTLDERILMITNGKNLMTGFKSLMSEEEIKAVAEYTFKLAQ